MLAADEGEVDATTNLRDLGFSSMTVMELTDALRAETGLELTAAVVFEHPTPLELAVHLGERLG